MMEEQRVSTLMRRSMEDGKFWFGSLLHEPFEFDGDGFWSNVIPFLQSVDTVMELSETERANMEVFVERKMEDLRLRRKLGFLRLQLEDCACLGLEQLRYLDTWLKERASLMREAYLINDLPTQVSTAVVVLQRR